MSPMAHVKRGIRDETSQERHPSDGEQEVGAAKDGAEPRAMEVRVFQPDESESGVSRVHPAPGHPTLGSAAVASIVARMAALIDERAGSAFQARASQGSGDARDVAESAEEGRHDHEEDLEHGMSSDEPMVERIRRWVGC